jgi:hypothetical protein
VQYLRGGYGVSEWRACRVSQLHRGTYRYQSHQDPQTELRMRMREIAAARAVKLVLEGRLGRRLPAPGVLQPSAECGLTVLYRLFILSAAEAAPIMLYCR